MPSSDTDTAQKLAEAIAFGDVEGAQALLSSFQSEVLKHVTSAASPLERQILLADAIKSTRTLLHLARSLRAHANAALRGTNCVLGYGEAAALAPTTWRLDA